jgi:hypothetical protein
MRNCNFKFPILIFRKNPDYKVKVVFNHKQTDYLEDLPVTTTKWRFDNAKVSFDGESNSNESPVCFSSTSKHLLMFDNADAKCQDIVNSICGKNGCQPEDMKKAPQLRVVFSKYEYTFDGSEYLYPQKNENSLTFGCKFIDVDQAENCHPGDFIVGRGFYRKYVPVLKYTLTPSEDGSSNTVTTSMAWLPSFQEKKNYYALKWAFAGIVISAIAWKLLIKH